MEKEFVPYEQALALEELGFDSKEFLSLIFVDDENKFYTPSGWVPNNAVWAPTFSQAFRWFREKYGLFAEITLWGDGLGYISMIKEIKQEEFIEVYKKGIVDTGLPIWKYEEAELECLKKLIEIINGNNN